MSRISSEKVLQIANTPWKSASGSPGASPRPRQPAVHRRRVVGGEHRQLPLALPRPLPNLGHREAVALAAGADLLPVGGGGGVVAGRVGAGEPSQPRPAIAVAVPPVYGHLQARLGEDVLVGAHGEAPPGVQAAAARLAFLSRDNATADADAGGGGGGVVAVVDGADRPGEVLELAEADGEHGVLLLLPVLLVGHLVERGVEQSGGVGAERGAAERARGVGEQPRVDAVDVERVAAHRQQPEPVVAGELAQADRAVERLLGSAARAAAAADADHHLPVHEHRERVDDVLVQPGVVQVEQLLQLPLQRRLLHTLRRLRVAAAAAISPTAAPEQESDKKMQQPGHEQHHSQYHQDEHHRRANPRRTGHRPAAAAAILVAPDYSGDHHLRSNATLISRGEAHNALLS
ncbi:Os06g0167150 [Oryza sativa Japonica Group]|uniref:Os06g0167150 protein n=1 Tax=Oryza sativa subsp. japonica TaxID=39947 RepID=C7J3Y4_ORYSJ|nr:Os06g0167150 [Oryza sativa Japonica Group]|eukprot:NP_001174618.1 Os06g0167150 [Oryza sativa Japonica Group]